MTRELRLDLDPWLEAPRAIAPLIDPNLHSCGTVPPHGYKELTHPEPGYFAVGIKSYGRAPTFLMATGYEQVRSVAAHLAGDGSPRARCGWCCPRPACARPTFPTSRPDGKQLLRRPGARGEIDAAASTTPPRKRPCGGPAGARPQLTRKRRAPGRHASFASNDLSAFPLQL